MAKTVALCTFQVSLLVQNLLLQLLLHQKRWKSIRPCLMSGRRVTTNGKTSHVLAAWDTLMKTECGNLELMFGMEYTLQTHVGTQMEASRPQEVVVDNFMQICLRESKRSLVAGASPCLRTYFICIAFEYQKIGSTAKTAIVCLYPIKFALNSIFEYQTRYDERKPICLALFMDFALWKLFTYQINEDIYPNVTSTHFKSNFSQASFNIHPTPFLNATRWSSSHSIQRT
jgi:hypothetical protein